MKKKYLLLFFMITLIKCKQDNQNETIDNSLENKVQIENATEKVLVEEVQTETEIDYENKYLITNKSVGYFKLMKSWQEIATKHYNYEYHQGYGSCTDACCDGGFSLGYHLVVDKYGKVNNPEITIGSLIYKESESTDDKTEQNKFKNNKNVFYVCSDNCKGWYWNDKISYLIIYSDKFKTIEGIGVGATLKSIEQKFGKLYFYVGWLEEDHNGLHVFIKSYPNVCFILDPTDYKGRLDDMASIGHENSLKLSDFNENTKIKRVIINGNNK
jgi:hypothetical protein